MSRNKTGKNVAVRVIAAVLIIVLVLSAACCITCKKLETPLQVYSEKPCPDAVYFGTSAVYRYWMAPEAYLQQGITVYSYTAGAFSGFAYKYFIKDLLKHQSPEMIFIEMRPFAQPEDRHTDHVQLALDYMPFSINKYRLLAEYIVYGHKYDMPIADNPKYYLPVQFRSDKTIDVVEGHIVKHSIYKGFLISPETSRCQAYDPAPYVKGKADLPFDGKEDFIELLDYCERLDCKVVFVASPFVGNKHKQRCINWMADQVTSRGFDCINFNTQKYYDAIGFDSHTDFYNSRHTNIKGAMKYTTYAAKLFKEKYKMTDHRGDPAYDSWQESGEKLREEYTKLTEKMH